MRGLFKEIHHFFELVFCACGSGWVSLLVHDLEVDVILLIHIVRASAAIFHCGREPDISRRLRKRWRVKFVISDITQDGFGCGDIGLADLSEGDSIDGSLKMEFRFFSLFYASLDLLKRRLDILVNGIYLILPDYGNGRLRSEFLRARPPHTPVPSHEKLGTRW